MREKVAKLVRVEVYVGAADKVMVVHEVAVIDRRAEPQVTLDRNVKCLIPARVVRLVQGAGLGDAVAFGIRQDQERVELLRSRVPARRRKLLAEGNLDGEQVSSRCSVGLGRWWRLIDLDNARNLVGVERAVDRVQQSSRRLDVVELDAAL